MSNTLKKLRRLRGRPALPASERNATRVRRDARRKDDGARLNEALRALGWTQAEAAKRSDIPQGHLNEMLNGVRDINREDLRRLGNAGIPPEFLLGLTATMTPVGMTRPLAELHRDLAAWLAHELLTNTSVPEPWLRAGMASRIDGEGALAELRRIGRDQVADIASYHRRAIKLAQAMPGILNANLDPAAFGEVFNAVREALIPPNTSTFMKYPELAVARKQLDEFYRKNPSLRSPR